MPTPLEIKKIGKNYQVKFDNGSIYKGGWLNGKMHGIETLTFSNGDSYKGDWQGTPNLIHFLPS